MTSIQSHLQKFPNARPSTLAHIDRKNAKIAQLERELAELQRQKAAASKPTLFRRLVMVVRSRDAT